MAARPVSRCSVTGSPNPQPEFYLNRSHTPRTSDGMGCFFALSVAYGDSSPKGRALGRPGRFERITITTGPCGLDSQHRTCESGRQGPAFCVMQSFARFAWADPICQGLPLWGRWQHRKALTERASLLAENEPSQSRSARQLSQRASQERGGKAPASHSGRAHPRINIQPPSYTASERSNYGWEAWVCLWSH